MIVPERQSLAATQQNAERGRIDAEADKQPVPHHGLGAIAEGASHACQGGDEEQRREHRQYMLDAAPAPIRPVVWHPKREQQQAGVADRLQQALGDVLRQQCHRPLLKPGVELESLTRVELDGIREEAPGHAAWPDPHQPRGAEYEHDAGDLIEQQHESRTSPRGRGCATSVT